MTYFPAEVTEFQVRQIKNDIGVPGSVVSMLDLACCCFARNIQTQESEITVICSLG